MHRTRYVLSMDLSPAGTVQLVVNGHGRRNGLVFDRGPQVSEAQLEVFKRE